MPHFISAAPLGQLAALDVHQLYKLRVDFFVHEQRCPYAEIDATDADPQTVHLLAWDADTHELLGTARVFPAAPANDTALPTPRLPTPRPPAHKSAASRSRPPRAARASAASYSKRP